MSEKTIFNIEAPLGPSTLPYTDTDDHDDLDNIGTTSHADIDIHVNGDGSDHSDVADNTTAIALNTTHRGLSNNPHTVTLEQARAAGNQLSEGGDIVLGTTTGSKIGTAINQKLGFFNKTPVIQPAAYTPSNVGADRAFDANNTTIHELADILGTLIADLQGLGLIG